MVKMQSLASIETLASNISGSSTKVIKTLHKFVFGTEGDRGNRRRLREFTGFGFDESSNEFRAKVEFSEEFSVGDLISICNILCIDYAGSREELVTRILRHLMNLQLLATKERGEDEADYSEESADEDEVHRSRKPVKTAKAASKVGERRRKDDEDGTEDENNGENEDDDEVENEDDDEDESEDDGRRCVGNKTRRSRGGENRSRIDDARRQRGNDTDWSRGMTSCGLTFRDIEGSVRPFNGEDNFPIQRWISEFEDTALVFGLNDLQKYVYAKKSLNGLAKLFIQGEPNILSWYKLKEALLDEFSCNVNSAQLHQMLSKRKMKKDETVQEYLLIMKGLANSGQIETAALIQYVIDGINDDPSNKIVLYGASNLREFKKKLETYSLIKSQAGMNIRSGHQQSGIAKRSENAGKKLENQSLDKSKTLVRCFNCGGQGHKSQHCRDRFKGPKCFACNEYGHLSSSCPKKAGQTNASSNNCQMKEPLMNMKPCSTMKTLHVNGIKVNALVDTGSDLNLIRSTRYLEIGAPNLNEGSLKLNGIGQGHVTTVGKFETEIEIDSIKFNTPIYIVPDNAIPVDLIVGRPVLKDITLIVNSETLQVTRSTESGHREDAVEMTNDNEFLQSLAMVIEDVPDVGNVKYVETIKSIIRGYTPTCTKETDIRMKIILRDELPIYKRPRRLSRLENDEVDRQIEEWLDSGIIRHSSSDFASPIVLVKKKTGDTRICVDYRELNKKIIKDRYPLPVIEDQIDKLRDAKIFTTLDLKNGFFHVPVDESSIKYTSFVTPHGQYEFLKTPFGLCNSPAVFQRYINDIFRDCIKDGTVLTYMDDLIIPAGNEKDAIERLEKVLSKASEYGLEINWKKCQFMKTKIEYLGHLIENNIVRPSPHKVSAVMRFPRPTTIKQIQSYLGLTGYFRKFIKNYSILAKPLSDLLKEGARFKFGKEEEISFEQLKQALCDEPVLRIFNFDAETELHTDASSEGYGAILLQRDDVDGKFHPVYYMSRKTIDAEKKYNSYELEVLAIIEALKKFRVYLLGIKFKIVTDCSAFTMTMNKKDLTTRVARWALLMEEFDYAIEHRPGKHMKHCDALSRYPMTVTVRSEFLEHLAEAQRQDAQLKTILEILRINPYENFVVEKGILYKEVNGDRLLVVPSKMQTDIIRQAHENGHFAVKKTKDLLMKEYWIPKLEEKIKTFISNCVPCILAERKSGKMEGLLHPIEKGDFPLQTYHVDHLGPLCQTNKGYKYILAVIDAFTKFVWIYPTKTTNAAEVISKLEQQREIFGNPKTIISDRGTAFTSSDFEDYCKNENIRHVKVTTGVPRGNGQIERINRTIIPVLTKLSIGQSEHWYKHVRKLQEALNSTYQRSIGTSPFELLFGVPMKRTEDIKLKELIEEEYVNQFVEGREDLRKSAKEQIQRIQRENCRNYNKKRKEARKYNPGDLVAVKKTQFATCAKILPKFMGPYRVQKQTGVDRYEVRKVGNHVGPRKTQTSADNMKPWSSYSDDDENDDSLLTNSSDQGDKTNSFETNDCQDGRVVGTT